MSCENIFDDFLIRLHDTQNKNKKSTIKIDILYVILQLYQFYLAACFLYKKNLLICNDNIYLRMC